MSEFTELSARELIDRHHAAWSTADVAAMLANCHDDIELVLNAGGRDGEPLRIVGKAELGHFLEGASSAVTSRTQVTSFSFRDGVARTTVAAFVRHRQTGHTLEGTYRQVVQFDGPLIMSLHEFHDAALLQAFWRMIEGETATPPEEPETL